MEGGDLITAIRKHIATDLRTVLSAGILAILRVGSLFFYYHEGELFAGERKAELLLLAVRFLLSFALFLGLLSVLVAKWERIQSMLFRKGPVSVEKRSSWKPYLFYALIWIPLTALRYPGALCWDTWHMLAEYRNGSVSAHHSVFLSALYGSFIAWGEQMGNPNVGLFVLVLLTTAIPAVIVFGYASNVLERLALRRHVRFLCMAMWAICPQILAFLGVAIKDFPYVVLCVFLTAFIIDYEQRRTIVAGDAIALVIGSLGLFLCRRNGAYLLLALAFVYALNALRDKRHWKLVLVLVFGFSLGLLCNTAVTHALHARAANVREMLALPFQQTARYAAKYEDEVSQEERAVIEDMFGDYHELAQRYDARIVDAIKFRYDGDRSKLPVYFRVWAKQFRRHPGVYLAATWDQNYYLFVPESQTENISVYRDADVGFENGTEVIVSEHTPFVEDLFTQPQVLAAVSGWLTQVYMRMHKSLVPSLMSNIAYSNICLWVMVALIFIRQKRDRLKGFLPALVAVAFVIVGPVIQGHARYFLGVTYVIPLLIMYLFRPDKADVHAA